MIFTSDIMKIIDKLNQTKGQTLFSFEVLPPFKGVDINTYFSAIEPLMDFDPAFIDVTYHREDHENKLQADGTYKKVVTRKRPGTVGICAAIIHRFGIDPVPHLICGGFNVEETENALIDLHFLGIDNILALRGDAIKSEGIFHPTPGGHHYASDLIQQIAKMNKGIYLDDELTNAKETNFCIGVAAYPEKHFEAPTLAQDLEYLKMKVDLGAEYVVTQMFFNNDKYFEFVEMARNAGITIPIIPGLKPITTKRQVDILPEIFFTDMPEDLVKAVRACKDNDAVKDVGVEWGIQQSKELKEAGVPVLHYYTMSKSTETKRIVEKVF